MLENIDLDVSLEGLAAAIGLVGSAAVFLMQQRRMIQLRKQENYLALELASNELFRYEAQYGAVLSDYMADEPPETSEAAASDDMIASNFYLQALNLFEIAVRLRGDNGFDPKIFGSWVIWFHDTAHSWYFRENWPEWRENYTRALRRIFDEPVRRLAEGEPMERAYFFDHVAEVVDCPVVKRWLADLERR